MNHPNFYWAPGQILSLILKCQSIEKKKLNNKVQVIDIAKCVLSTNSDDRIELYPLRRRMSSHSLNQQLTIQQSCLKYKQLILGSIKST